MKKTTLSLVAGMALLISTTGFSQERTAFGKKIKAIHPTTGIVRCVSSEYEEHLQEIDAKRATTAQFEQWLAPKIAEIQQNRVAGRNTNAVITIPVVVHVIHNGQSVGNTANISDARILSQITVLNEDYRRIQGTPGFNNNPVGADVEIQFCMAQRKPDGTATNGIDRINFGVANFSTYSSLENNLKPQTIWDSSKYLNIWVVQFTDNLNAEMGGTLGYAQFPSNSGQPGLNNNEGGATTDGVVIDWRCFGSSTYSPSTGNATRYFNTYDKGRTTTHEVGHFLGLRHIWGDGGSQNLGIIDCSATDYCADTPVAGWDNYDCLQTYDSCPTSPGNDMVENYMDYTNDSCMNIFTQNQKDRITAVMNNSPRRVALKTSNACEPPLSTPSFELLQGIKLYPNPTSNLLNITAENNLPDAYKIYNSLGQVIVEKSISTAADLQVNTSNFSNGVYMIKIVKDNESRTIQFVKN
ncbi:T9SS type A sorting domain-containing protein [Flavobacterium sp. NST-5]|uniref:T9SS type A sorting domain-containing protein n=1 Tax=Flavobacterium ichthyis TaxID=2698827 RepID=A0ABW9Z718_9FLAO|nr:M43 family zinc metalloprotease [Flavobacterium ichthyis]NBL64645.1 T9SS type A sorting domain-containing protein [Flavobacterium ichthyis]